MVPSTPAQHLVFSTEKLRFFNTVSIEQTSQNLYIQTTELRENLHVYQKILSWQILEAFQLHFMIIFWVLGLDSLNEKYE